MGEDKIPETENGKRKRKKWNLKKNVGVYHLLKVRSRETTDGDRRNLERAEEVRMVQ